MAGGPNLVFLCVYELKVFVSFLLFCYYIFVSKAKENKMHKITAEEKAKDTSYYVDYDSESKMYGVYGNDSGF